MEDEILDSMLDSDNGSADTLSEVDSDLSDGSVDSDGSDDDLVGEVLLTTSDGETSEVIDYTSTLTAILSKNTDIKADTGQIRIQVGSIALHLVYIEFILACLLTLRLRTYIKELFAKFRKENR